MGYCEWACNHWVVDRDNLWMMCNEELQSLQGVMAKEQACWIDLADEDVARPVMDAWEALQAEFSRVTSGLELYLTRYDEESSGPNKCAHEGVVFCVEGMVEKTPAGRRWSHMVHEASWVDGG